MGEPVMIWMKSTRGYHAGHIAGAHQTVNPKLPDIFHAAICRDDGVTVTHCMLDEVQVDGTYVFTSTNSSLSILPGGRP
jgi:hypothetical protein